MSRPDWSIVIPAYNEAALIPATIASIRSAWTTAWPQQAIEIIVCDNNSTDTTAETARASGAHVVAEPHNQIARARNTGAHAARGTWLMFVDADTHLSPDLIAEVRCLREQDEAQAGGARVTFDTGHLRPLPALVLAAWNTLSRAAGLAAGSFIFCRRADWEAIGGFDQSLYAAEEIDFSRRLKKHLRRARRGRFVICRTPVRTSARKLEWHTDGELLRLVPLAFQPWKWRRREACTFWYQRPADSPPVGN